MTSVNSVAEIRCEIGGSYTHFLALKSLARVLCKKTETSIYFVAHLEEGFLKTRASPMSLLIAID